MMELGFYLSLTKLLIDNQGCIGVVTKDQTSSKTEHIVIRLHRVRELIGEEMIVRYTERSDQLADILTKTPSNKSFYRSLDRMFANVTLKEEANLVTMQQGVIPSMGLLISLLLLSTWSYESPFCTKGSTTYQVVYFLTSLCWGIRKFHLQKLLTFAIKFTEVFMKVVQHFDDCDHSRRKGDLLDKIVDVSLYVVSNLIDTLSVRAKTPNRDYAVEEFYQDFDLLRLHHKDAPKYLALA